MKRRANQSIFAGVITVVLFIIAGCSEYERPTSFKSESSDSAVNQHSDALNKKSGNQVAQQTYIVDVYLVKVKAWHSHDTSAPEVDPTNEFFVDVNLNGFGGTMADLWPKCILGCPPPTPCIQIQAGQTASYFPYIYLVSNQMDADDTIILRLKEKDIINIPSCIPQAPIIVSGSTSVGQLGGIGSYNKIIYEGGLKAGCYAHFQIEVR